MLHNLVRKFVYYKHIASGKLGDMSWNDWEHVQKDPARRSQFEFIRVIDLDNPGGEKAKQDLAGDPVHQREPPIVKDELQCPLCGWVAKNDKSLRMHKMKK